jgi:amino acid transporter
MPACIHRLVGGVGNHCGGVGDADVVTTFWGAGCGGFFIIIAVLAQCSIYNTYIASGSRGFFALAEDNLAPPVLVKVDKKHGVPYVAVLSVALVNLILCNFAFTTVVIVDVFLLISSYIMVYISAMILRKRLPAEAYRFKIRGGYPVLVVLCVIPIIIGVASYVINGTTSSAACSASSPDRWCTSYGNGDTAVLPRKTR